MNVQNPLILTTAVHQLVDDITFCTVLMLSFSTALAIFQLEELLPTGRYAWL